MSIFKKGKIRVTDLRPPEEIEMEKEAAAGVSLGAELDRIVDELNEIGKTEKFFGTGEGFSSTRRNIRACEIGEELNKRGGRSLMQKVWYRVTTDRRALEMIWDGIGDWLG